MNINKIVKNNTVCAVIYNDKKVIVDAQSALDLLMTVKYEAETKNIIIDKALVVDDFFILSTGIAGEILQKLINYGARLAVYGDFSRYTSKPLRDFIYESNNGRDVFFADTEEAAIDMLTR